MGYLNYYESGGTMSYSGSLLPGFKPERTMSRAHHHHQTFWIALSAFAALSLVVAGSALARIPWEQGYADGCTNNVAYLLFPFSGTDTGYGRQSWVYVNNSRDVYDITGTVVSVADQGDTQVSDTDLSNPLIPSQDSAHEHAGSGPNYEVNSDWNINVDVDEPYQDAVLSTGNPGNIIHTEFPNGTFATNGNVNLWQDNWSEQVVPYRDDRVRMSGTLPFDCGHPPFRTEFHPFHLVQTDRARQVGHRYQGGQPKLSNQTDVEMNDNRGQPGIIADWELTNTDDPPPRRDRQSPDYTNRIETLFIPAPGTPDDGEIVYDEQRFGVPRMNNNAPIEVYPDESGIYVVVDNSQNSGPNRDNGYAAHWFLTRQNIGFSGKEMRVELLDYTCDRDGDLLGPGEIHGLWTVYGSLTNYSWKYTVNGRNLHTCDQGLFNPQTVTLDDSPDPGVQPPKFELLAPDSAGGVTLRTNTFDDDWPVEGDRFRIDERTLPLINDTQRIFASPDYHMTYRTTVLSSYP